MKNRYLIVGLFVASGLIQSYAAAQTRPLKIIERADFADMSEKEKEVYVAGVLEGQSMMLYSSNSRDLKPFTECINGEGITKITRTVETLMNLDDPSPPIPWTVARAIGALCRSYR